VADAPVVVSHFRAAIDGARMLAEFLREIAEKAVETVLPTRKAWELAKEAASWHMSASDLVSNLEAVLKEATGLVVDEEEHEPE
jgi:poly-gamma-glutamate capsule biosynthesis protein CapA/YwtB (metallophosphatase superfamily)